MLEVFQNPEKRKAEDGGNSERSHHMTHLSSNPPLLSSVRIGSQIPSRTTNPKLPLELHHPPTMPMQLASNVMVVPPQQIATSSSHQALLNSFHKRKGFPLAVAHPIVRQNPNYNAAVAHSVPKVLPHQTKMVAHRANTPQSQESPLDLSAPLDLSIKRKKDPETDDLSSQNILKRQRTLESQNGKGDHIITPKRTCPEILSKPPPIYPGLRAPHIDHYARQQRKVHPLVHERPQSEFSELDLINHQYLQLKAKGNDMTTDEKLRFARKAFALQSAKILERNGGPSHRHGSPPHKEARLPVKRAQMAVPPLVTAGASSSRPLTQNDQVPVYVTAQQFSEHNRLVNEEKKNQLLARAAAMGIPVEQEPYRPQRSPHLIKENGAVDAEMEEALRKMMMRSTPHQPSPPLGTDSKQHPHRTVAPQQAEIDKRVLEKFAYFEFMKRQMLLRRSQESSQLAAQMKSSSQSSLPTQSPPLSSARPTSHLEQQDLKRRLLYEMHLKKNLKQASSCIHPFPGGFNPQSPPRVGVRIGECSSKKVTGSSYQYKFTPKDMTHRQSPSLVPQDRPKKEPPKEDLQSCQWLIRNRLDSKPQEYQRECQKLSIQTSRESPQTQSQPQDNIRCSSVGAGATASRGPISQGLPHPISQKTLKPSMKAPHYFTDHVKRDHLEKSGAASSSFRNRKNLLNPKKARDHILASMDPALRDLFQGKDQEKQRQLLNTLRENHNMHIQRTKGFAINFRDMIAHQISKCIDESSDSSEVIDLTNETSESPSLLDKEKRSAVSSRTSPQPIVPKVKEGQKNVGKDDPPPLVKVTDSKAQFVPLTSNSVIHSGSITHKEPCIVSKRSLEEKASVGVNYKPAPEMPVIVENTNVEGVKLEPEEKVRIKKEVDIQETEFEKLTDTSKFLEKTETKDDLYISSIPGSSHLKSSKTELPDERSEFLVNSSFPKSVSYDPRRRILAALNERLKTALLSSHEPQKEVVEKTSAEKEEVKTFTDTKIIARADQDDKECKIPDQLLEDDDEDGEKTEEEQEVAPKEDETPGTKEEEAAEVGDEVTEEPPKPKRKRKRRVRRYYHIAPRRTSSRKVTKRRPPQVRRPPAQQSKPKFADFAPEVLQMRTRNSDGRRRQAAMASSYHRDTRYEQEIEKEQQKVMERRRRRSAVLQNTSQQSQDVNEVVNEEGDALQEEQGETEKSFEKNKAVVEDKENISSTNNEDQTYEDGVKTSRKQTEVQERYFLAAQYDLKVRIQKKHLVRNFPSQEKKWQALKSSAKVSREKKCVLEKPIERKAAETPILRRLERNKPSTSGLFSMQLNGLPKRRKQTKVRNRLLKARVIPTHHTILRPSVPLPPRELKRLAVNKKLGETLLHKAARLGHDDSALYCISYCTQDINAKDNAGYTPLHECCVNGRLRVAKHMIASGADVNGSAADGTRPVHDAIDNEKVELARLLLAHGGDPLIATYSGRTTRKLARSNETKTLIHGYLKDVNGRLLAPPEDLENLQKLNFNIRFHTSVQTSEELTKYGVDFMDGAPEPTLEEDEMMFELSDEPMLPSFSLYVKECKRFGNWLLLSDVLQRLDMTRADFLYKHRDVTVYSINRNEVESSVQNSVSQVKGIMGKTSGKCVELVELDHHIRGILGSEETYVR